MIDLFALILNTKPNYPSVGMGEDVVYKLQQQIDNLEQDEQRKPNLA